MYLGRERSTKHSDGRAWKIAPNYRVWWGDNNQPKIKKNVRTRSVNSNGSRISEFASHQPTEIIAIWVLIIAKQPPRSRFNGVRVKNEPTFVSKLIVIEWRIINYPKRIQQNTQNHLARNRRTNGFHAPPYPMQWHSFWPDFGHDSNSLRIVSNYSSARPHTQGVCWF